MTHHLRLWIVLSIGWLIFLKVQEHLLLMSATLNKCRKSWGETRRAWTSRKCLFWKRFVLKLIEKFLLVSAFVKNLVWLFSALVVSTGEIWEADISEEIVNLSLIAPPDMKSHDLIGTNIYSRSSWPPTLLQEAEFHSKRIVYEVYIASSRWGSGGDFKPLTFDFFCGPTSPFLLFLSRKNQRPPVCCTSNVVRRGGEARAADLAQMHPWNPDPFSAGRWRTRAHAVIRCRARHTPCWHADPRNRERPLFTFVGGRFIVSFLRRVRWDFGANSRQLSSLLMAALHLLICCVDWWDKKNSQNSQGVHVCLCWELSGSLPCTSCSTQPHSSKNMIGWM